MAASQDFGEALMVLEIARLDIKPDQVDRLHEIAREARDYLARGASGFRSFRLLTCEEIENRSGYGQQFGLELLGVLANEPLVEHYRVVEEMQVGDIDL